MWEIIATSPAVSSMSEYQHAKYQHAKSIKDKWKSQWLSTVSGFSPEELQPLFNKDKAYKFDFDQVQEGTYEIKNFHPDY